MDLKDFTDLGNGIGRRINDAVSSMNFDRLSSDIREEIDRAFGKDSGGIGDLNGKLYHGPEGNEAESRRAADYGGDPVGMSGKGRNTETAFSWGTGDDMQIRRGMIPVAGKIPGKVSGVLLMIFGILSIVCFGLPAIACGVMGGTLSSIGTLPSGVMIATGAGLAPLGVAGAVVTAVGVRKYKRAGRLKLYLERMKGTLFCAIKDLATRVNKSERTVVKDLEKMIHTGFFPQGHMDDAKSCFIGTDAVYMQYIQARDSAMESARVQQNRQEAAESTDPKEEMSDRELEAVIAEGEEYIKTIRDANDAIYNAEISEKLFRMETVLEKIFDYVRQNPEKVDQLRQFMNYYMPITERLVVAYRDLDKQTIVGQNMKKAKLEIAQTLDTINTAYEKLYDSMYSHVAMDVSSDIAVLKTLFAQEGLTKNEMKGD